METLTEAQKEALKQAAIKKAEQSFREALSAGVHEDVLTDLMFEVTMGKDANQRLLKYFIKRFQK
jgi:hypothetical protein